MNDSQPIQRSNCKGNQIGNCKGNRNGNQIGNCKDNQSGNWIGNRAGDREQSGAYKSFIHYVDFS